MNSYTRSTMNLPTRVLHFLLLAISQVTSTCSTTIPYNNKQSVLRSFNDQQRFVPWSNTDNQDSQSLYLVDLKVNTLAITMPVDTGSTGVLLSAAYLNHTVSSLQHYEPGFEYLSSSKRYYEGYMLPSNLTFTSLGQMSMVSKVDILAVTERGHCSSFIDGVCAKTDVVQMPGGIRYMGVGFGRWSKEQPYAKADRNPLLNIAFDDEEGVENGYIISQTGVVLGVTQQDRDESEGWKFTQLTRKNGDTAAASTEERPEWNGTPMCVQVAGSECFTGTALLDTGLNYSFIGVPKTATEGLTKIVDAHTVLVDGTEVAVNIGTSEDYIASYSFNVGDFNQDQHITPAQVKLVKEHVDGAFINTGRLFYNGFDLFFEEGSGTVGLRARGTEIDDVGPVASQQENMEEEVVMRYEL